MYSSKIIEFSFSFKKKQVPNFWLKDFVKGYTDGDGYFALSKKGKPRLQFTCGSEKFLENMCDSMKWKKNKTYSDKRSNAKSLQYYGQDAYKIIKVLYQNSSIYLDRKYKSFIEIENAVLSQRS